MSLNREELLKALEEKFAQSGQNLDVHLSGLLHSTDITYWDYIQTEALLSLQIQRTTLPDEMVFIAYHQINELLFKMILWEIKQISFHEALTTTIFTDKLYRISRYFDMLATSFEIMQKGMSVDQYMQFRDTLTPASGFQSAQYRQIEFASTELINLIDFRFRATINRNTPYEYAFDNLYWQAAGVDHKTGKKNALLTNFETKYKESFIDFMKQYNAHNLYTKFKSLPEEERNEKSLINAMRHYDHTVNVKWVMAHYHAAGHYIDSGKGSGEATGGSDWRKYMHPRYQRRIFFPSLWTAQELENWGLDNLEGCVVL
jgi:tryptophan 2,3-dioxygenase